MAKKKGDEKVNQTPQSDNEEQNFDEEPDFDDPEGYVDDIPDEELLADILEKKPKESDGYENVVVVDGCPQVGPERLEKLQSVINKIFGKFGKIVSDYYPTSENGNTTGYIFLEYDNPQNAAEAVKATNNCKLDKQHTFLVNLFTDFKKYSEIPKEWEPPTPQPFKVQSDLQWYLMDPDAYDQYLVGIGTGVALQVWQNALPEPVLLQERPNWTETYAVWSPLGTYLATFHWRGVALWAGPKFSQFQKFFHPEARFISFSPCENYIVTFSPSSDRGDDKKLIIWDIRTGQEKRSFPPPDEYVTWPIFRWSKDDKFFARLGADVLSVYETPGFGLLDKKSIKITGIRDFSWSPTDNVLAYWVAEDKDVPARVTLLELPNRTEIRSKNLFSVADCKIHLLKKYIEMSGIEWDPTGRYVVTGVSSLKCKMDCGYYIRSFQGKELVAKRTEQMKKHVEYREAKKEEWAEQKPRRLELRNYVDTDGLDTDQANTVEEVVEFFVKEEQTVIE
ncbi:unnamed protein product, partial [Iphiclides podalirius]